MPPAGEPLSALPEQAREGAFYATEKLLGGAPGLKSMKLNGAR